MSIVLPTLDIFFFYRKLTRLLFLFRRNLRHDFARSVATETGNHQLDRVSGTSAERAADAHAQLAASRSRDRAVHPGQMAVRAARQPGDRQRNNGLDTGVEILQAPAADRMLEDETTTRF